MPHLDMAACRLRALETPPTVTPAQTDMHVSLDILTQKPAITISQKGEKGLFVTERDTCCIVSPENDYISHS